jgi:formate dehydrogenase major subunit
MSLVQQSLVQEIDYGTPRSKSEKMLSVSIDGKQISVPEGTSIMRAAMETGIEIPKLCATDMLDAFGSCRLCLVEIEGRGGTPASCTTPVAEGIVVRTKSERLDRLRKGIMELYVSDHPVDSLDRAKHAGFDLLDKEIMVKNQPQPGRKNPYDDAHKPQLLRSHRSICGSNRTR